MSIGTKTCSKCGTAKSQAEFGKRPGRESGLRSHCKSCEKQYRKAHPEVHVAAVLRHKQRHPEKYAASAAVGNAVKYGLLTPQPCRECGEKAEAHHPSYAPEMRLSVVWLCHSHHIQLHREVRQ